MVNTKYICLVGDIIKSSQTEDERLFHNIGVVLQKLNSNLKPLVNFSRYAGDEFQGLLSINQDPFDFIDFLEVNLIPLRFRVGIGIGDIISQLSKTTYNMRGNAFLYARESLERAKKDKQFYFIINNEDSNLMNILLELISFIKAQWSDEMVFRRYNLYRNYQSIYKVAKKEGVSPEAINKFVQRHGFREIINFREFFFRAVCKE